MTKKRSLEKKGEIMPPVLEAWRKQSVVDDHHMFISMELSSVILSISGDQFANNVNQNVSISFLKLNIETIAHSLREYKICLHFVDRPRWLLTISMQLHSFRVRICPCIIILLMAFYKDKFISVSQLCLHLPCGEWWFNTVDILIIWFLVLFKVGYESRL